jgi:hypothetical protein
LVAVDPLWFEQTLPFVNVDELSVDLTVLVLPVLLMLTSREDEDGWRPFLVSDDDGELVE